MEVRSFRLRVKYRKAGRLAMLSHLELTHALERTIRRSGLPFALTQGFSPHMRLSFGSALPVGIGSECEIFDIVLEDYVSPAKALAALEESSVPDLMCISAEYVEPSAKAASVAFPFSVYEAQFDYPLESLTVPETIEVIRKKKAKTLTVGDFLVSDVSINGRKARFQLESGQNGTLRPDVLLMHSIASGIGDESETAGLRLSQAPSVVSVTRIAQSDRPMDVTLV